MKQCYNRRWCHKLTALTIATAYFLLLIFINNTTYVWATLALFFVLFVTTFTCTSSTSPLLLHLRGTRAGAFTNQTGQDNEGAERQENTESVTSGQQQMTIWVTDVPPSYNIVMADVPPQTPPPSYGSAILMFPPAYIDTLKTEDEAGQQGSPISPPEGRRRFRPLSISTQVSVTSAASECPTPIGTISFSTQISMVNGSSDPFSDTMSLRHQLFLSRQVSREDITDGDGENGERMNAIELHSCEIPIIVVSSVQEESPDNPPELPSCASSTSDGNIGNGTSDH